MQTKLYITILTASFILSGACSRALPMKEDPFFADFFDMTRHIMSSEEIEIYNHLPDAESKEEFIEEFWAKRDPDPNTLENESRENFQERIDFANRHFEEHRGQKRGWDTMRGRILLQLGFPDERRQGNQRISDSTNSAREIPVEIWFYYRHKLELVFADKRGFGEFDLITTPPALLTAIDNSKYDIDQSLHPEDVNAFRFQSAYRSGQIEIQIPTQSLKFTEIDEQLSADFSFTVYVYRNYRKIDTLTREIRFSENKKAMLEMEQITLKFPYSPTESGHFFLDILGKDLMTQQRFRNFCQLKN